MTKSQLQDALIDEQIENRKLRLKLDHCHEMLLDCFTQGCGEYDGKTREYQYDHMCLSTYEGLQDFLIEIGMINASNCRRQ